MAQVDRRWSFGAELVRGGAHVRVHAPKRRRVACVFEDGPTVALDRDADGHFAALVPNVRAGARYRFRLDDERELFPDPASRFQPEGPHGPSELVDPTFPWTDRGWKGVSLAERGHVLYELHVGTFTREGTWAAAAEQLAELACIGITVIEMMPVADFAGRFGWGYDGVDLWAPTRLYGRPDDLRAFVDRAHALGMGVILDVVYNHIGPSGNYLTKFGDSWFTKKYDCEWGDAIDFETDPAVRAFFVENAAYWIDEFHFDGLRLDATQCIYDASKKHVLAELTERARAAARGRAIAIVSENEPQHAELVRDYGHDALWNDDFHHSARVAATGRREAYFGPVRGSAQELISAVKWGYLFQGQYYAWQKKRRGHPALDLLATHYVAYLENHDQVANSARGLRVRELTVPGKWRALTTLLLLAPATPMLFQGQEFGSSAPFLFFADHEPDLARLVQKGRGEFIAQFPSIADPAMFAELPAPHDPQTFERCKLRLEERTTNARLYAMHVELLRLRREDPVFSARRSDWLHGAVLRDDAFVLRFATGTGQDRVVVVNLGADLDLGCTPEPLLAPPTEKDWRVLFTTEDPRWSGCGTPAAGTLGQRIVPANSALVLTEEVGT